jgi:hypothetical protein
MHYIKSLTANTAILLQITALYSIRKVTDIMTTPIHTFQTTNWAGSQTRGVCNSQTAAQRAILDTMDNNGQIVPVDFNDEAFLAE